MDISIFYKKEFWGNLCFGAALVLTIYSVIAYSINQKVDLSQCAILIAPLFGSALTLYSVRSAEGYFQNKLTIPPQTNDKNE